MKTSLIILATAAITWITFAVVASFQTGAARLWMISAVKAPGSMAIREIQADMKAGRYEAAKAKIDAFAAAWARFNSGPDSCRGPGIGDVMVAFGRIDTGVGVTNAESGRRED